MAIPLILDTDAGSDVDDVLALATIFGSPELEPAGVTTVYGDTLLRAKIVVRVGSVAGRSPGPVLPGRSEPRSGREVWWAGHEGALMPDLDREEVGAGDPIELLASSPTVVAIGPLTNVAEALERPGHAIERIYLMGGDYSLAKTEHNVQCDIDAAAVAFASGVPVTAIGLEQTTRVRLDEALVADIEAAGALGALLAAEIRAFWKYRQADFNQPHDPAAVLMLTDPELFSFATGTVEVDASGLTRFTPGKGPHRIVTDFDPQTVARRIVDRIVTACRAA